MSKNAEKIECRADSPEFKSTLKSELELDVPSLLPLPDISGVELPGIEKPEIQISFPKPKLPSPTEAFKMKMDGFKFQVDLLKQMALPDFKPPETPKIPTQDQAIDIALGIEVPEFPDLDISLPDITPQGVKFVCLNLYAEGDDINFLTDEEVTATVKDPDGKEIKTRKIGENKEEREMVILVDDSVNYVTVEMTGMVVDSQENKLQKKVEVKVNV